MEYESTAHCKYLLLYHLIFVCKDRKKLLVVYGKEVKRIFEGIAAKLDFRFEALEVDHDRVQGLVKSPPHLSPLAFIRRGSQESTFQLWQRHEKELQTHFWKEQTFWSDGYFCCTVGNASQETIRRYIEQQG